MWEYFITHYVKLQYGIAFPLSEIAFVLGVMLILSPPVKRKMDILWRSIEFLVLWLILTMGAGLIEEYFSWTAKVYLLMPSIIILYAIVCSKYPADLRVVYGGVFYSVFLSSISLSSYLGTIFDAFLINFRYTTAIVQPLMMIGISVYVRICKLEKYSTLPKYCSGLIILISCIHLLAHNILVSVGDVRALIDAGFIVIEIVSFHLYYSISKMYDEKIKLQTLYLKQEKETYVMEMARGEMEKIKELRHDMKNHYTFMSYLMEEGRTEELKNYFQQYATELYDVLQFSLCGNYTIDYILNFEMKRAKMSGVQIDYKIIVPPQLPFEDKDICSLLTNILDNAIEAASKMEDKTVKINLEWKNDVFLVRCVNATDQFTEGEISSHLPTSKSNREAHGYGMKIIRSIVKKYNGALKLKVKDSQFHLSLFLGQEKIAEESEECPAENSHESKEKGGCCV